MPPLCTIGRRLEYARTTRRKKTLALEKDLREKSVRSKERMGTRMMMGSPQSDERINKILIRV